MKNRLNNDWRRKADKIALISGSCAITAFYALLVYMFFFN